MKLVLTRHRETFDGKLGILFIDGNPFSCYTVENKALAIACGIYKVEMQYSPHFNRQMPHIIVPGRTDIMFHWANYPVGPDPKKPQLKGCVGLGDKEEPDAVDHSIVTFNKFFRVVRDENDITVEVKEEWLPSLQKDLNVST